jgi:hypothetical protein
MSSPPQVTIVRDGKELGTYDLAEVLRLLAAGTLKPTDYYWHEGMRVWELLSKLDTSGGLRLPSEPEVKPQSNNESNGCCGGCGLLLFVICGSYSVYLYFLPLTPSEGKANAEAGAYICGAISLLGLFTSIPIFIKK